MPTNTNEIKVLLYGKFFRRDYRSRILMKFLQDSEYCVSQVCPDFYETPTRKNSKIKSFLMRFSLVELYIKAAFADVIYLPPMNTRLIKNAIWASKLFNKKLVVEMYVSIYDTLIDRKLVGDGDKKAEICKKQDVLALTKSDYIIHTAGHELSYWEKLLNVNVDKSKVFIAPNCNTTSLILKRKFMEDGVLRICWWGSFIPLHGLDNILQAIKILKEQNLSFTCNLLGVDKPPFYTYVEKIKLNNLEQCVFLRKDLIFSDGSLPDYLIANCDLALGIFGNTDKARHAFPNKVSESLLMKIPTLTMNSPALEEFFNPKTDLWTCEPSPESIAKSILTIARGAAYPVDWEQTRQKAVDTFSVARYQEVLSKVLSKVKANSVEVNNI